MRSSRFTAARTLLDSEMPKYRFSARTEIRACGCRRDAAALTYGRVSPGDHERPLEPVQERSHWEMVTGIVAIVIGVGSLAFTAYSASLQRKQAEAGVWPRLSWGYANMPAQMEIHVRNKGVGPAIIRDVRVHVGERIAHSWVEVAVAAFGETVRTKSLFGPATYGNFAGAVLSAGEDHLALSLKDPLTDDEAKTLRAGLVISICYCSTFDDCFWLDEVASKRHETTPVKSCPAPGSDSFEN
jgi:hypothetical protein